MTDRLEWSRKTKKFFWPRTLRDGSRTGFNVELVEIQMFNGIPTSIGAEFWYEYERLVA